MQTAFDKVKGHIEKTFPETMTENYRVFGALRINEERPELVTENTKPSNVFDVVVGCRVIDTGEGLEPFYFEVS